MTILDNPLTAWLTRLKQPLSTGNATLADKVLTPDGKTSRCPARCRAARRASPAVPSVPPSGCLPW
jgi:hypothetical protein